MRFAYLTTDDVNLSLALRMAADCDASLEGLSLRDAPPAGRFDAVLYDWDYLPPDKRREVLSELQSGPLTCPVALHGYNLGEDQVEALRRQGAVVSRRLEAKLFLALRRAVRRVRALVLADDGQPRPPASAHPPMAASRPPKARAAHFPAKTRATLPPAPGRA